MVERGEANHRIAQLVDAVVPGLRDELLDVERVALQLGRDLAWARAFLDKALDRADTPDVPDEQPDETGDGARHGIRRSFEERLAGRQRRPNVTPPPRIRELVARDLGAPRGE